VPAFAGEDVSGDGSVRGLEQAPRDRFHLLRGLANAVLFLPRVALDGVLSETAYGAGVIADPSFVADVREFLIHDRWGTYPVLDFGSSDSLPAPGLRAFFRNEGFGVTATGVYQSEDFWRAGAGFAWDGALGGGRGKLALNWGVTREDNRFFAGIGARPQEDERSAFLPGATAAEGRYLQRQDRLQALLGWRIGNLELLLDNIYRKRTPSSPSTGSDALGSVFDLERLPGAATVGEHTYHELAARFDSRRLPGMLSPGASLTVYTGVQIGAGDDRSRLLRAGGDAAAFIPVLRHDRLLVPRLTLDTVSNLREEVPISFLDYPRHLTFRGVSSSRRILRTDEWVAVPSVAYQWPLTPVVSAQVFVNALVVGAGPGELGLSGAPWAAGVALEMHTAHRAVVRTVLASGSEGLHFLLEFGTPIHLNERARWN
jgi:hypothetical protein